VPGDMVVPAGRVAQLVPTYVASPERG